MKSALRILLLPFFLPVALLACIHASWGQSATALDQQNPHATLHDWMTSESVEAQQVRRRAASGPSDLTQELAAARQQGIPLLPGQLQKPVSPPAQDAAPLYEVLTHSYRRQMVMMPWYLQDMGTRYAYSPADIAEARAAVKDRREMLAIVHRAARKSVCVFQRDWSKGDELLLPEFAKMREVERLLKTESYLMALQGKDAQAIDNQSLGFCIAKHAASDPSVISYLVGIACDSITLNGLADILEKAKPNAFLSQKIERAVAQNQSHFSLRYALAGDVALKVISVNKHRREELASPAWYSDSGQFAPFPPTQGASGTTPVTSEELALINGLLDDLEAQYLHRERDALSAADQAEPLRRATFMQMHQAEAELRAEPTQQFLNRLLPSLVYDMQPNRVATLLVALDDKQRQLKAKEAILQAAAAVFAQKAQTGVLPSVLPRTAIDPFSGKSLRYRREGGSGFVVYSGGPDGTFNGRVPSGQWPTGDEAVFVYPPPKPIPVFRG